VVNKLQETSDLEKSSNSHRDFGAVWKEATPSISWPEASR